MTPALVLALLTTRGLTFHGSPVPVTDVKVPVGFSAYLYSDHPLANDIYTMTIDDDGRVLVAGRGYVRVLVDDDGDGRADRAVDLIDGLKDGPMGLLAEGDSLYVVADGGLKRYRGYNGRDKVKTPPETLLAVKTAGEHDAHAVRRGPDGWLYLMCGNMAGVKKEQLDPLRSPVKDPIADSLVRISPDGKTVEAVADGFRNAYGFDFHPDGEAFTFDSDNERDVGLPWYEPCRFYHVVPGGNYGWRSPQLSQTWRKPPYFADVVPPVCTTGRGSPTGVACYRSTHFPGRYRGGFFLADWTFGRVYHVPLERKHSTYAGKPEVFLEATGENGFAPTALAVHPKTGELFVSIGGRGTRGAVYRVRCNPGAPAKSVPVAKRTLDWDAAAGKQWIVEATCDDPVKRRRALELMLRWREKLGWGKWLGDALRPNLGHEDALIRAAAGRAAVGTYAGVVPLHEPLARLALAQAEIATEPTRVARIAEAVLADDKMPAETKLIAVRVLQLAFGDLTAPGAAGTVWEGYTFRAGRPAGAAQGTYVALEGALRTNSAVLEWEVYRTLACLGPPAYGLRPSKQLAARYGPVARDLHYLIVLSRLGTSLPLVAADVLLDLDEKAGKQGVARDRHWPLRVEELAAGLAADTPALGRFVLEDARFGRPEHLLLVKPLKLPRADAAYKFLAAARGNANYPWSPGIVALLGEMPADELPLRLLRRLWDRGGLEDAIIAVLARDPEAADTSKFVVGLRSLDPDVVRVSAAALAKLAAPADRSDLPAAVTALRKLPDDKPSTPAREAVAALLRTRTGEKFGPDAKAWADWLAKARPDLAAKLAGADGLDAVAWKKREANIPWAEGDAARGQAVFVKATCATCHDGGRAVGPSLLGVGKRFGRDDLLTAILQPSKDVPPRYRPTRVVTADGRALVGMIVYEATDGVILQTGPDTTVRIAGDQIESKRMLDTSLMPAGLLDKLTDREVADLLAYLRKLDVPK